MAEETVTFSKGANSDVDPSLQPNGTYRDGLNGNLISEDGNHYSYESVKGTKSSFTLPFYNTNKLTIIGWRSLGNKLIVHSTDHLGNGQIGLVFFNDSGAGSYVIMYHEALNYSKEQMQRGYAIEENSIYHRDYWTDDFNPPRTINLANESLTTNIAVSDFVNGESYMILGASNSYLKVNGTLYGVDAYDGGISPYIGVSYTFQTGDVPVLVNSPRVVKYLDPNLLNYTPNKMLGGVQYLSTNPANSGSVFTGVTTYTYRLTTLDGYQSGWSPLSNFVHVTDKVAADGYQQYEGDNLNASSGRSIQLEVNNIDTAFDKIELAVFESHSSSGSEANNSIDASYIFAIEDITGEIMEFVHSGQENLDLITVNDIAITPAGVERCKDIVTLKQRQIILNLKEREKLDDVPKTGTAEAFTYTVPADNNIYDTGYFNSSSLVSKNGVSQVFPGGHYIVLGGTCTYGGVTYADGDMFTGLDGIALNGFSTTGTVYGIFKIKTHTTNAGVDVYDYRILKDEFFDYNSPLMQHYGKGYWRDETYRLALLFFDKLGVPFAAQHLTDYKIPSQGSSGFGLMNFYNAKQHTSFNICGIEINNIDITDIKDRIGGLMIVRAERDETILAQGMTMAIINKNGDDQVSSGGNTYDTFVPFASITNEFNVEKGEVQLGDITTVYSPDIDYDWNNMISKGPLTADRLEPVVRKRVPNPFSNHEGNNGSATENIWRKFYDDVAIHSDPNFFEFGGPVLATRQYLAGGEGDFAGIYIKNYDIPDERKKYSGKDEVRVGTGCEKTVFHHGGSYSPNVIVNYTRPSQGGVYGGTSDASLANTTYISTGHYLKIDSDLLADVYDAGTGKYILNGMQIFGGDCFVGIYDRVNVLPTARYENDRPEVYNTRGGAGKDDCRGTFGMLALVALESNINMCLVQGNRGAKLNFGIGNGRIEYQVVDEEFIYNGAYSSELIHREYAPLPLGYKSVTEYPYRARYSELKQLGELVDNMRIFLEFNKKEADGLHGPITAGVVGGDRLFYLQERGVGYFPIEERELSSSAILGAALQLGTGGIMERADNVDRFYGCQHKFSTYITESSFGWFDFRRKTLLNMSFSGGVNDIAVIKGQQSFFNNAFVPMENLYPSFIEREDPVNRFGIVAVYDSRHKLALMTFMFTVDSIPYDFTVGISTQIGAFIGKFSFTPHIYIEHNNTLLSTGIANNLSQIVSSRTYSEGDLVETVRNTDDYYVCIEPFTASNPPLPPEIDNTHWRRAGSFNDAHRHWKGDVCNFFGLTYPFQMEAVFTGGLTKSTNDTKTPKSVDLIEAYGNDTAFTDVYYSNSSQESSDTNVDSDNKDFGYVNNAWWFSTALQNGKERLLDHYMKIKLVVKNYNKDKSVSLDKVKRIVYLKTDYRNRK